MADLGYTQSRKLPQTNFRFVTHSCHSIGVISGAPGSSKRPLADLLRPQANHITDEVILLLKNSLVDSWRGLRIEHASLHWV